MKDNYVTISHVLASDVAPGTGSFRIAIPEEYELSLMSYLRSRLVVGQNAVAELIGYSITYMPPREVLIQNEQDFTWPKGTVVNLSLLTRPQDVYMLTEVTDADVAVGCVGDTGGLIVWGDGKSEMINIRQFGHTYEASGDYTILWFRGDGSVVATDVSVTVA